MTVPAHAERVDFGVVFKVIERPSRYLPGVMAQVRIVECPSCHREHDDFPPLETLTCQCGLKMCCDFGITYVWRDEPAMAES